ncbi:MAG: nuclear transport factor 2 family protein [Cyclobacteriaceae bacterium]|nr:nuclear transport factor 2 family protein [Cyclobacteriaceae bacterium]
MKNVFAYLSLIIVLSVFSCASEHTNDIEEGYIYVPIDQEIHNEIVAMDSVFFEAYNTCDIEKQAFIYSDSIEFFHDQGGLMTSKKDLLEGTEKNICGKVTREVVKGSIEVYPINKYGAVQIGLHKFYNNQESDSPSHPSKFIIVWKKSAIHWKITKVISLH